MPEIGDSRKGGEASYYPRECYNPLGIAKRKYFSKSEAKSELKRMVHKTMKGLPMQRGAKVYKCPVCSAFHIGHNS